MNCLVAVINGLVLFSTGMRITAFDFCALVNMVCVRSMVLRVYYWDRPFLKYFETMRHWYFSAFANIIFRFSHIIDTVSRNKRDRQNQMAKCMVKSAISFENRFNYKWITFPNMRFSPKINILEVNQPEKSQNEVSFFFFLNLFFVKVPS